MVRRCRSITSLTNARIAKQMTVLSLMVEAYQVRWVDYRERLETNPSEAKLLDEHGKTVLFKSFTRRIDDYPSHSIIRLLVERHRAAVWEGIIDLNGNSGRGTLARLHPPAHFANSPLVAAAWKRACLEILRCLTDARPSVPSQDMAALVSLWNSYRDYYGNEHELVNLLSEGGREAFAVYAKLHHLLRYCTDPRESLVPWASGRSLHIASSAPNCSLDLFRVILDKFPDQMRQADANGRKPLHNVVVVPSKQDMGVAWKEEQSKVERMRLLLQDYPQAAMVPDHNGQLPLHLAIQSGWNHLHLMELVKAAPPSLLALDGASSLYPFQLAASNNLPLTTIFKLLLAAPNVLASRIPRCELLALSSRGADGGLESSLVVPSSIGKAGTGDAAVSDELTALLHHVRNNDNNDKLWMDLQSLLRPSVEKCGEDDWSVLHAAVSLRECPIGLIRVLLHMHPEQLLVQNGRLGRTPLHCAAANAGKSLLATMPTFEDDDSTTSDHGTAALPQERDLRIMRLKAVLEARPSAARIADAAGQLPLHVAAYHGQPAACLEALIEAWPGALCQHDSRYNLYPFLWAACSPMASLTDVFLLLQRAPHVLAIGV